jgi:hypothetical protein
LNSDRPGQKDAEAKPHRVIPAIWTNIIRITIIRRAEETNMAEKWAVIVVHGVGNTEPGATVDALVSSLAATNDHVRPDGNIEAFQLPDKDVGWLIGTYPMHHQRTPHEARDRLARTPRTLKTFPMHFRRAGLNVNNGPREAIFAEVYWADLSRIREGTIALILSLLATVFSLRHIAEQAVDNIRWDLARWLRTIVFISASWLCGPIAALYGFMLFVLTLYYLMVSPLKDPSRQNGPISGASEDLFFIAFALIAVFVSAGAWIYCRWNNSGSTWTRLWASFLGVSLAVVAGGLSAFFAWPEGVDQWPLVRYVADGARLRLHIAPQQGRILGDAAWLLYILDVNLALLGALLLIGFVLWLWARLFTTQGKGADGPALDASYGTALAQAWLWLIVMPALTLVAVKSFSPEPVAGRVFAFLASLRLFLLLNLLFSIVFIAFAGIVVWLRWRWTLENPAPYTFPPPAGQREILRLIVHLSILWALVLVYNLGTIFVIADYVARQEFVNLILQAVALDAVSALVVSALTVGAALIVTRLRIGLHIVQDVINHFYRRWEPFPLAFLNYFQTDVTEFEVQQLIEARFRTVFFKVFDFGEVTHLTIIAHKQGTVIAVDVLSLSGLDQATRDDISDKLGNLQGFHLITMGSPLTHLYQHYFPGRYPSFTSPVWNGFRDQIRNWVNIYRIDDYVGTHVEVNAAWPHQPQNRPITAGGHTGYWELEEVFRHADVRQALPGQ